MSCRTCVIRRYAADPRTRAIWFAFYNFCHVHKSLRMTAAIAAGIADHIWSVENCHSPADSLVKGAHQITNGTSGHPTTLRFSNG